MRIRILVAITLLGLLSVPVSGCGPPGSVEIESPSGATFTIYSIERRHQMLGGGLEIKFRTDTPLNDTSRLEDEVRDLWEYYRPQIEAAGHKIAVLSPTTPRQTSTVFVSKSVSFVFERSDSGDWELTSKPGAA